MSAPCDKDRAWRSWGTANEASWQNSDFSIDHRLETGIDTSNKRRSRSEHNQKLQTNISTNVFGFPAFFFMKSVY